MARSSAARSRTAPAPFTEAPVVLLRGPERFLQHLRLEELRTALRERHTDVDTIRFEGASARPADVLDECRSRGLMQQHKLVVVDGASEFLKAPDDDDGSGAPARRAPRTRDLLEAYTRAPEPGTTLVLRVDDRRKGNLDARIEALGGLVLCEPLTPGETVAWTQARARDAYRVTLTPDAARRMVELVGNDLGRIDTEVAKLAVVTGGQPIEPRHVDEAVAFTRPEENVWGIQDRLLTGPAEACLAYVDELLRVSGHDPIPITWACADLARKLHALCRAAADGSNPHEAARALKLWGRAVELLTAAARVTPARTAGALLAEAVATDARQKSGQGDQVRNLEMLVIRFADALARVTQARR